MGYFTCVSDFLYSSLYMLALALKKFKVNVHFDLLVIFRIENRHYYDVGSLLMFLLCYMICVFFLGPMKFHDQKFKRALFVEVIRDCLGLIEPITLGTFRDRWHCKQNKKSNYCNRSITVVENKHMLLVVKFSPGESLSFREICIGWHYRRIWKTKRSS